MKTNTNREMSVEKLFNQIKPAADGLRTGSEEWVGALLYALLREAGANSSPVLNMRRFRAVKSAIKVLMAAKAWRAGAYMLPATDENIADLMCAYDGCQSLLHSKLWKHPTELEPIAGYLWVLLQRWQLKYDRSKQ